MEQAMSLVSSAKAQSRPYKGIGMEGLLARWYARNTKGSLADFRDLAKRIAAQLRPDALVLEVAPGPGFLAIEIARLGPYRVSGVDISKTFVEIAQRNAADARVDVEFRVGNASALPFPANWFDFLVNRAAFKNFGDPVGALNEMHRVLRPGGTALIIDMRKDATAADIALEVSKMNLGGLSAAITRLVLRWLRGRAYSQAEFEAMIARTPFGTAKIDEQLIGFEITLTKST
jgi:ubiquinone/menaquinone biosynthesis C-methylase UbiE